MPWTYPEIARDIALSTDIVYRGCYRAFAGGAFKWPMHSGTVNRLPVCPNHALELWDNDGIVNTAPLLWPEGENVLVAADYMAKYCRFYDCRGSLS